MLHPHDGRYGGRGQIRPLLHCLILATLGLVLVGCAPSESRAIGIPSRVTSPATSEVPSWEHLRRPLHFPAPTPESLCPTTTSKPVSRGFGDAAGSGPVYPVGIGTDGVLRPAGPRRQAKVLWVAAPDYRGPVLIRGRQLDGATAVQFQQGIDGELVDEFRFGPLGSDAADRVCADCEPGWRNWPSYTVILAPGCYAYQIDGETFSEVVVFRVVD